MSKISRMKKKKLESQEVPSIKCHHCHRKFVKKDIIHNVCPYASEMQYGRPDAKVLPMLYWCKKCYGEACDDI